MFKPGTRIEYVADRKYILLYGTTGTVISCPSDRPDSGLIWFIFDGDQPWVAIYGCGPYSATPDKLRVLGPLSPFEAELCAYIDSELRPA